MVPQHHENQCALDQNSLFMAGSQLLVSNLDWNDTSHNCYPWYFGVTWPWRKGLSSSQFTHSQNVCPSWILVSWDDVVLVGWLVVLRIYVASAVFQPYRDLEAGDNQSLKFKWRGRESNPGPLAPQAKSLTTRPPPLPTATAERNLKMLAGYLPFY